MPTYKRLIAQVHDIDADSPAQADDIARLRAKAVNEAIRPLGHATAWAPTVTEADGAAGELLEILDGCYLADETDDNPERNPTPGMVPVERTTVPERLLAWRDAAVRAGTPMVAVLLDAMRHAYVAGRMDQAADDALARAQADRLAEGALAQVTQLVQRGEAS